MVGASLQNFLLNHHPLSKLLFRLDCRYVVANGNLHDFYCCWAISQFLFRSALCFAVNKLFLMFELCLLVACNSCASSISAGFASCCFRSQTFLLLYTRTESGYSDHNFADKERIEMYVCMYVMRPQASTEAL